MAVEQLPLRVREFANYLDGLLARLDQGSGWCGVFWQRDPDGMRACLEGREVPPWDVVGALLQDLAAAYGAGAAGREAEGVRALHAAALAAFDVRPGGRDALADSLDVMLREQRYAAERQAELGRLLASATSPEQADAIRLDLAWAQDDHERATVRCAELRFRMTELDRRDADGRARGAGAVRRAAAGDVRPSDDVFSRGRGTGASPVNSSGGSPAGGPVGGPRATGPGGGSPAAGAAAGLLSGRAGAPSTGARVGRAAGPYATDNASPHGTAHDHHALAPHGTVHDHGAPAPHGTAHEHDAPAPHFRTADGTPRVAPDGRASGRHPYDPAESSPAAPADSSSASAASAETPPAFPAAGSPLAADTTQAPEPAPTPARQRKRRRGSARFAGMAEDEGTPAVVPQAPAPTLPAPAPAARRTPRGARFAGAAEPAQRPRPRTEPLDAEAARAVAAAVETLQRLRGEGRTGEAHALLAEIAHWPAARLPLLAAELQRAGHGADWATLLWEAASLPADGLVAAADALVAAGRAADGQQILRQGVVRPAGEIGEAVLGLAAEGRTREVRALLDAYVRVRTPEEAARSAAPDPQRLVPLLLEAARGVSDERHWDLVHALRVAGFTA
ncbi:hypothetical protein ACIPSA_12255 [Streptomyces sp. NPDC086549]|uniref:hypothetical protein n=1 Tax=Streptomyces sp. NPDC086549 TaxID=3365752 RepID=UPI00382CA3CA